MHEMHMQTLGDHQLQNMAYVAQSQSLQLWERLGKLPSFEFKLDVG